MVFDGEIDSVLVEQSGPIRAVIKLVGTHRPLAGGGRKWLPFVIRLSFYAGGDSIRAFHTFLFDGDKDRDSAGSGFGLVEVCAELIQLLDVPEIKRAWLDYCELYNGSDELQSRSLGKAFARGSPIQGHSRLTAYAAKAKNDPALVQRAWTEFRRSLTAARANASKVPRQLVGRRCCVRWRSYRTSPPTTPPSGDSPRSSASHSSANHSRRNECRHFGRSPVPAAFEYKKVRRHETGGPSKGRLPSKRFIPG